MDSLPLVDVSLPVGKRLVYAQQEARLLAQQLDRARRENGGTSLGDVGRQSFALLAAQRLQAAAGLRLHTTLRGHRGKILGMHWCANLEEILLCSQDGFMVVWNAATGHKKHAVPLDLPWVLCCASSALGQFVASGGLNNACTVYRVLGGHDGRENAQWVLEGLERHVVLVFRGHTGYVSECAFAGDRLVVTASGDMTCSLWDVLRGLRVREFAGHLGDVLCLSVAPESVGLGTANPVFVLGGSDGRVRVWDAREQRAVLWFRVLNYDVNTARWFPGGSAFAVGSDDGVVRMYDLRCDGEVAAYVLPSQLPPHEQALLYPGDFDTLGVSSVDFSASGRLMFASYPDHGAVVWDTVRSEVVGRLGGHSERVGAVGCSPDGLAVATSSWDRTIRVWSVQD